jgi:NADPH2:quinone reductase
MTYDYRAIEIHKNGSPADAFRIVQRQGRALAPDEIRIASECSGVNYADVLARQGMYPEAPPLPYVPGYEIVGRVVETGKDVTAVKTGDRVISGCSFGGYASQITVPAFYAQPVPDDLDSTTALTLVTQGQTAVQAFEFSIQVYPEDIVLIHAAAGGVGSLLVQLAKHKGCKIIATCGSPEKVRYLRSLGVDLAIDYRALDFVKETKKWLGKRRVDVAFDSLGGHTLRRTSALLGTGGRLVTYGVAEASNSKLKTLGLAATALASGILQPTALLAKSKTVAGINMLQLLKRKPYIGAAAYKRGIELYHQGVLAPLPGHILPVEQIAKAHDLLEGRKAMGKIAISWLH